MRTPIALIFLMVSSACAVALDMNVEVNKADGAVYMNLWGTIEHGDDNKFRSILLPYIKAGDILFKVNIFSVGGDVQAAMGIGDQIRTARGMTIGPMKMAQFVDRVAVPTGEIQCWFYSSMDGIVANNWPNHQISRNTLTNNGPRWCECASACFLIWASGMARDGSWIGVHRFRFNEMFYGNLSPMQAESLYSSAEKQYREYVRRLNVPESIIDRMFATPSSEMYYLSPDEIKLVSNTPYLEELVQAKCGSSKATEYWEGDAHISTEDPEHIKCTRNIVEQAQRQGARDYLAKYGDGSEATPHPAAPTELVTPAGSEPQTPVMDFSFLNHIRGWKLGDSEVASVDKGAEWEFFTKSQALC